MESKILQNCSFSAMNTAAFMFSQSTENDTITRGKAIDEVVLQETPILKLLLKPVLLFLL
jgi:hypothetical protein